MKRGGFFLLIRGYDFWIDDYDEIISLVEFKESEFMKELFGEQTWKNFYYAKLEEFDAYRINVSKWERDRYITRL